MFSFLPLILLSVFLGKGFLLIRDDLVSFVSLLSVFLLFKPLFSVVVREQLEERENSIVILLYLIRLYQESFFLSLLSSLAKKASFLYSFLFEFLPFFATSYFTDFYVSMFHSYNNVSTHIAKLYFPINK